MTKKKLPEAAQLFIVQGLARFDTPQAVAEAVNHEFSVKLTRQGVEKYDPTKQAGRRLSRRWRVVFDETRKAFMDNLGDIGISHRIVRLRRLDRLCRKAEEQGNLRLALKMLQLAAMEAECMAPARSRSSSAPACYVFKSIDPVATYSSTGDMPASRSAHRDRGLSTGSLRCSTSQ